MNVQIATGVPPVQRRGLRNVDRHQIIPKEQEGAHTEEKLMLGTIVIILLILLLIGALPRWP